MKYEKTMRKTTQAMVSEPGCGRSDRQTTLIPLGPSDGAIIRYVVKLDQRRPHNLATCAIGEKKIFYEYSLKVACTSGPISKKRTNGYALFSLQMIFHKVDLMYK